MDEIESLFRDWVDCAMSAIGEGIYPGCTVSIAADWRYFIAAEAKPRAQRLGITWSDDFIDEGQLELMQDETP